MLDIQIEASPEVDQYAPQRMAAAAAAKAKRLWPGVIGEVLADEIMAALDLPSWMQSRTARSGLSTRFRTLGRSWGIVR